MRWPPEKKSIGLYWTFYFIFSQYMFEEVSNFHFNGKFFVDVRSHVTLMKSFSFLKTTFPLRKLSVDSSRTWVALPRNNIICAIHNWNTQFCFLSQIIQIMTRTCLNCRSNISSLADWWRSMKRAGKERRSGTQTWIAQRAQWEEPHHEIRLPGFDPPNLTSFFFFFPSSPCSRWGVIATARFLFTAREILAGCHHMVNRESDGSQSSHHITASL